MSSNFVFPEEITYFIDSIRPFQVAEVGSKKWLEVHEMIIKLSQQAILEASEHREEEIKEFLIARDKLKVLIHEAYCIFLWKTRVLPHLLDIDPNPSATFMIYTVFFHEGVVVSLLDTALFHGSGCEALQDSSIDLVDYAVQGVSQVIGLASLGHFDEDSKPKLDEATLSELERQKRDLIYKIGLRCISILNYLADNAANLPLNAIRRMVAIHDVPWLMADLLHFRPWERRTKKGLQKFIDDKWTLVEGDAAARVIKLEAQTWFCLRQLLLNNTLMESYDMYEERRQHLSKCQGLLYETVLDQLPPLIDLKEYLCRISIAGAQHNKSSKDNLILEELPEIKVKLIMEAERAGGFFEIAQQQEPIFLCKDSEKIVKMAQTLNNAYNTDLLADFEYKASKAEEEREKKAEEGTKKSSEATVAVNNKICGKCGLAAEKKCGKCENVYYCSKECQLEDWPIHKKNCVTSH